MKNLKILSLFFVIILIVSFVLLVLGRLNVGIFWLILILIAIYAFKILPKKAKNVRSRRR